MDQDMVGFLHAHPLLQGVPDHELAAAAAKMDTIVYAVGESIIKEGSVGHDALFIVDGTVQVYTRNLIGRPVFLAELGSGDIVGEIALLLHERRSASIRARSEVTVLRLEREAFAALAKASPMFHGSLQMSAEIRYVHALLRKASIWSAIPDSELRGLAEITVRRPFARGDVIIREGEKTEQLFLITAGRFEVRSRGKRKAILGTGDYFGELVLLADIDPMDTVIALEDGELLLTGKAEFTYILQQYPPVLIQFAEVIRIRWPDLQLSEPYAAMIAAQEQTLHSTRVKSSNTAFHRDIFEGRWVEVLFGLGGVFLLTTLLAIFLKQPIWNYAALLMGAFVGPVSFVVYLRNSQLLGFRPGKLIFVFLASALVAIPMAWNLERIWLFSSSAEASFSSIRIPLAVALIEEIAKLVICGWMIWRRRYRFLMDAIVFGAAAGMGFAAVETVLYGWTQLTHHSGNMLGVIWARALFSPFGHGTWTAIAAAGIWFGLIGTHRRVLLAVGLPILSVTLHTLWNYDMTTGHWHILIMLLIGVLGLYVLYLLMRTGQSEEQQALVRINPILDEACFNSEFEDIDGSGECTERRSSSLLYCEACDTQSPPNARYCARCGQSLRLRRSDFTA
ncbi:cyclic nucleotide-binding domain-containing protein [Paenibacillus sp. J2TS4]|uniref:cyclic nucleotide-binding domain-containing protein n=1 Tax=Paenibacillus sp. J2TS4 TaxID=2807194 RepID=UPI001B2AAB04|nr:cyclic nucleotide-binding domain-containing protein [Paenibacillus sp. J2TS4]GIP31808.1 hypothetical protein J2TS4_10180 [Paenibacillus sp. J2TS4]